MVICCMGDSLTEGDYGIKGVKGVANVHAENYPYFLKKLSGEEVYNYGRCGARSSHMLEFYRSGIMPVGRADVIVLMLGTNGGQSSTMDSDENRAYRELVALLRKDAPRAKLYLCTPPHVTVNPAMSNCGYAPQVSEAVKFVRMEAKAQQLPLIDLAAEPRFCAENEAIYQPNDGLHYSAEGYKVMAEIIWQAIKP